jgi:hypothetical protein
MFEIACKSDCIVITFFLIVSNLAPKSQINLAPKTGILSCICFAR